MPVSTYNNTSCKYRIDKLAKVVYLYNEDALKNIKIDNGNAYVENITQEPLALRVYDINLSDTDELDERYKFTHTLTFSVNGYANYTNFQGRYYVVVKSVDEEYWLVNPMFPCKVTYTYSLSKNDSHTDFTLSTASNHPTLRVIGMKKVIPTDCGYRLCGFKDLKLNEKKYSRKSGNLVIHSNYGFEDIHFDDNSQKFTEQFDGTNVSHQIDFNIKFDDYKSSWHYNLLEFNENLYSAIINTTCGKTILTGFHFGLQPSFTVSANDEQTPDNIQIQLTDMHNDGNFVGYFDTEDVVIEKDDSTEYVYTTENDAWECVSANTAIYILKKEIDKFGNPTGNYASLEEYETYFLDLGYNIVGTFTRAETDYFTNVACSGEDCKIQTSFPSAITFNTVSCREYSVIGESNWSILSDASHITVSPTWGSANEPYTVQLCNTLTPTATPVNSTLTIAYCNQQTKTINVSVVSGDSCFQAGTVFDISANGQYVNIPTQCCIELVTESSNTVANITIQNNYIRVYVPQNNSGSARTFVLNVTMCDGTTAEVTINQSNGFERWVFESEVCSGVKLCELQRKYTGLTVDNMDSWTDETRLYNCQDSLYCASLYNRWIDSTETTCSLGKKYTVQIEQSSNDGITWTVTGNKRLGVETDDSPAECSGATVYELWMEDGYWCDDGTKYRRFRLYTSNDEITWIATDIYKSSDDVLERNSSDCGSVIPTSAWTCTKWDDADGYICEETTKYAREQMYGRMCDDCSSCNEEWVALGIYRRKNAVLETDSTDCGYDPSISGNCSVWVFEGSFICDETTKYEYKRKLVRDCPNDDCENCDTEWIGTNIYKRGEVLQRNSFDCGYIPVENYYLWRNIGTLCDGFDSYERLQKYISEDGNRWYETQIIKKGQLLQQNSEECGYAPPSQKFEYQWVLTNETKCDNGDKYYQYKQQRRISGSSDAWEDVIPTTYSIDGNGTMPKVIAEEHSEDCGYQPVVDPIYRWVNLSPNTDYYCDECDTPTPEPQYKWVKMDSSNYICDECEAIEPQYKWVVLDSSQYICDECGIEPQYRTLTSGTTCVGYDKYTMAEYQVSYDSGVTWTTTATSATTLIEVDSEDCGYEPPTPEPHDYSQDYLTFVTIDNCTFATMGEGGSSAGFNYSLDSGETWQLLDVYSRDTPISVPSGRTVLWKYGTGSLAGDTTYFVTTGRFNVQGNVMSLLFGDDFIGKTDLSNYRNAFDNLFNGTPYTQNGIISAENLILPATTLSEYCYVAMFYNCTSLTKAPVLPATTLVKDCYRSMFRGCTSLTSVTCLATDISASGCTENWMVDVPNSGVFVKSQYMSDWTRDANGIPNGWTVNNYTN